MPLTCNIDSRGRVARLVYGILLLLVAVVLLFLWALPGGSAWAWVVVTVCAVSGGFAVFEARAGWCALRAMGFKTPL